MEAALIHRRDGRTEGNIDRRTDVAKVIGAFATTRKRLKSINCNLTYFKADVGKAEELNTEWI